MVCAATGDSILLQVAAVEGVPKVASPSIAAQAVANRCLVIVFPFRQFIPMLADMVTGRIDDVRPDMADYDTTNTGTLPFTTTSDVWLPNNNFLRPRRP